MTPYYQDDAVTIYHGDAREIAPTLTGYEAILTDPPYGIDYRTSASRGMNARARDWAPVHGDDRPFDPEWLLTLLRCPTVLWGGNHYASRLPDSPSWLVWDKRVSDVSNDSADCEMAWTNLGGPARMFRHRWMGMLRDSERGEAYHPTQKPVALMRWVVSLTAADVILDPYMGSGSTLVAAKDAGRRAVGIEVDEAYCERAAIRCSQEVLGLAV